MRTDGVVTNSVSYLDTEAAMLINKGTVSRRLTCRRRIHGFLWIQSVVNNTSVWPAVRQFRLDFRLRQRIISHVIHRWKGLWKYYPSDTFGILYDLTGSINSRWRTADQNFTLNIIIITQLVTRHKSITISDESQTRNRRVSLAERATV